MTRARQRKREIHDFVQDTYKRSEILAKEDQIELLKQYRRARNPIRKKELRDRLLSTFWRFAVNEAKKFSHIAGEETVRQAAYIGLLKALNKYKLKSGRAITTCMHWWVRVEIIRCLYKTRYRVMIPEYLFNKLRKAAIESDFDISTMTPQKLALAVFGDNPTVEQVRQIHAFLQIGVPYGSGAYIQADSFGEEDLSAADAIERVEIVTDVQRAIKECTTPIYEADGKTMKVPAKISERDHQILLMYYSMHEGGEDEQLGLIDIGRKFGITRERVRQILSECYTALKEYLISYQP